MSSRKRKLPTTVDTPKTKQSKLGSFFTTVRRGLFPETAEGQSLAQPADEALVYRREQSEETFAEIFESASETAEMLGTVIAKPRPIRMERHLLLPEQSPSDYFRVRVYNVALDQLIGSLRNRFADVKEHVNALFSIVPAQVLLHQPSFSDVKPAVTHYQSLLPDISERALKQQVEPELHLWSNFWRAQDERGIAVPANALLALDECNGFCPLIRTLLRILAVLPVSSCTAERTFSKLKNVCSEKRSTMGEGRLGSLILIQAHRDHLPSDADVLRAFAGRPGRRLEF